MESASLQLSSCLRETHIAELLYERHGDNPYLDFDVNNEVHEVQTYFCANEC